MGEVVVRCGTLFANATTLGFVEDVAMGAEHDDMRKAYDKTMLDPPPQPPPLQV